MNTRKFHLLFTVISLLILASISAVAKVADLQLTKTPVRFAIIGDRTGSNTPGIYEEIVAEIERLKPDFVMTVGDAIQGYTEDTVTLNTEWDEYLSIVKPLGMPIYYTPGNHDITTDAALKTYQNRIGEPYYSFNARNYHFIILDVTRWESGAKLPKEELDWLTKDLASNREASQTLVFYHKPFWYNTVVMGLPDSLHTLFKANGVDAVFNGHLHSYFSARLDGILYTAVGSSGAIIDAMPSDLDYHFIWVTLDDSSISVAPIKKGSVKAWDVVTASELHLTDKITRQSIKFNSPVPVSSDLKVPSATATLEFENLADQTLSDTIKWYVPAGWAIQPISQPIIIKPKEKKQFSFQVNSTGNLYPVPTVSLRFPYNEGKNISVSSDLRISRTAMANVAAKPPVIDGELNDECWKNSISKLVSEDMALPQVESTCFYVAYDQNNLYVAAHCHESKMDSLHASIKQNDGAVYGEDCIGLFLQPDLQIDTAYQIYFNPLGTILDQKIFMGILGYYTGRKSWDGSYIVKAKRGKQYWDVEACIPWAQLQATGQPGQTMGINLIRKQRRLANAACWQIPIDYDPKTYGTLLLQ